MFGDVRLETFRSLDWTSADVRARLQGRTGDVVQGPDASIRVLHDVLTLRIGFFASRNVIPDSASIEITSFSPTRFKYQNSKRLTILIDGSPVVSEDMEVQGSFGGIAERLSATVKYADFLKLVRAKEVTLHVGKTQIQLRPEVIEALNRMETRTTELKPAPVWRCVG